MATAAKAKERRRAALDAAYRAVTSGRRVRIAPGVTVPQELLRDLESSRAEDR